MLYSLTVSLLTCTQTVFRAAIDFCFPGICAACRTACDGAASLCAACELKLDRLTTAPICDRCASPLAYLLAPCPRCLGKGHRPFERIATLGVYEDPLPQLIQAIKYHGSWEWVSALTDRLIAQRKIETIWRDDALLVPIPLHPFRRLTRSYNQADLIAERLSKKLGRDRRTALMRVRHTPSQTLLHSQAKRKENLQNAFAVESAKSVRGRHVILVDDVMTSGATLRAAATALRAARPASISACVLAVADRKGRRFENV